VPDVYAPGDAGDFPVKQAFLAFLQADTVAERIAADLLGHPFERPLDPVSMCIMEMRDPDRPVTVRAHADGDYKIGTGATWRLGKKMLGATVPMRFHAGKPFHAGLAWQMMDVGLKGMSAVLAEGAARRSTPLRRAPARAAGTGAGSAWRPRGRRRS